MSPAEPPADAAAFRCAAVIPARYGSSRFPGKPLHLIAGRPLVRHVWDRCRQAAGLHAVIIATDDERIAEAARGFGADVRLTSPDHPSGTDRLAEVAENEPGVTHFLNVQGDEPLISPDLISQLVSTMRSCPGLEMITAATPISRPEEWDDPNVVKVVLSASSHALYFSRSRIPHPRHPPRSPGLRHMGIYGYSREFLRRFVSWPPGALERAESLEQLRALENDARIAVVVTGEESPGVDTPQQAAEVERRLLGAT